LGTLGFPHVRAAEATGKLRVLSIGVVGTVGGLDRQQIANHPDAEIVGLCDVDSNTLAQAANDHPKAFTCRDYREAFDQHVDKFDAVIVATPDHTHGPIMLTAFAHDKHVYGQKPLVHQLEELSMMEKAIAAKPQLVTQLGNQRMAHPGRRAAVEILRREMLGKAIKAYAWVGSPNDTGFFNFNRVHRKNSEIPKSLDYKLWLGPAAEMDYYDDLAPIKWRSWWDFGTNGLGDWGCHLLDVFMFAYDELQSPFSVKTDCEPDKTGVFHPHPCKSVTKYKVSGKMFANEEFPIYYNDSGIAPTAEELGIPEPVKGAEKSVVVCEGGTLVLSADGGLSIWRDGKSTPGLRMPGLPRKWPSLNHWHAWVDNCLGRDAELRTPFKDAVRITEPCLLAVKAGRFPGKELLWDKSKLAFTNDEEATRTVVRRQYREGFAPPKVG
ncbi:MAG: Gfo/Idh/MocA family oxidoreductase, partial [Verrucomicrobiota bacterium]